MQPDAPILHAGNAQLPAVLLLPHGAVCVGTTQGRLLVAMSLWVR